MLNGIYIIKCMHDEIVSGINTILEGTSVHFGILDLWLMHNSAAPYDDKLPNAGCGCKYMKCNASSVTANHQLTNNQP